MATEIVTSFWPINDSSGDPVSGARIYVYDVGTTTLQSLYSDTGLSVAVSNPIICNSAGRTTTDGGTTVGMVYKASGSYKIVVKTSADVTLYTLDNIDGRVPVGSGALAIANGGTAATTAATALSNLGGASAADLADLAADVASLAGAAASTEKTHIATGTTAQRPATPVEGDIRRNTTTGDWEGYDGSTWNEFAEQAQVATDIAAADVIVTAAFAWVFIDDQDASSSATIEFTGLGSTYDAYVLRFSNVKPATDDTDLVVQVGTGATPTWVTGANDYTYASRYQASAGGAELGDATHTGIVMTGGAGTGQGVGNAAGENISGELHFDNPEATDFHNMRFHTTWTNAGGAMNSGVGGGRYNTAAAITAVRFAFSSGNIASGHFVLYGLRRA
jgi:hypothetical protein